jgi:hypothetical protein
MKREDSVPELPEDVIEMIRAELSTGNVVEVKRERDNIVIVRLDRKLRSKTPIQVD